MAECKALEDLNLANNLLAGPLLHIHWADLSNLQHLLLANNKVLLTVGHLSGLVLILSNYGMSVTCFKAKTPVR